MSDGGGDERWALLQAGALIRRLDEHGLLDERRWTISREPGAPWVIVAATSVDGSLLSHHFAIWVSNGDLYPIAGDGSVGETPIALGDVGTMS